MFLTSHKPVTTMNEKKHPFHLYGDISMQPFQVSVFPLQVARLAGGRNSGPYQPMMSCCTTPTRTTGTRPGWTQRGDGETFSFFTRSTQSKLFLPVVMQPLAFPCRYYSRKRAATASQPQPRGAQALPSSDAVLNCPACMTTLCLDCQR